MRYKIAQKNPEIRNAAHEKQVPLWMLAAELGTSETSLYRWLRTELPEETKRRYLDLIDRIAKDNATA